MCSTSRYRRTSITYLKGISSRGLPTRRPCSKHVVPPHPAGTRRPMRKRDRPPRDQGDRPYPQGTRRSLLYECLIRMRVWEMLADIAHVDLPGVTGVIVIVDPGGDQALPGYLEMRIHENGAVRMYV